MDPARLAARLRQLVGDLRGHRQVRHAVVGALSLDGGWSWQDAAGEARPDGTPTTTTTPWFLASVTKLHIAAVVLRLHEQGRVDLHAPVAEYLPAGLSAGLHVTRGVDHTAEITPTHLLGHLSGLADWIDERPSGGRSLIEEVLEGDDAAWSSADAVTRARDRLVAHFPPSDPTSRRPRIRYSDTNYQLLMVIAEQVTGKPMPRVFREQLFEPLGLRRTWVPGDEPLEAAGEPATVWIGSRPLVDRPLALASFGDLYSTLDDVLAFGRALVTGAAFDDPSTAKLMWGRFNRFGLPRGAAALRAPSWPIEYGLGMMRFKLPRALAGGRRLPTVVGHTGSTGSWLWYVPDLGVFLAGTVDQATAAAVPFRAVAKALAGVAS